MFTCTSVKSYDIIILRGEPMRTKYDEYIDKTSELEEKYQSLIDSLEAKKDELNEMHKEAESEYMDLVNKYDISIIAKGRIYILRSRSNKDIDQKTKARILDLYSKMKSLEKTYDEIDKKSNKCRREREIARVNVRRLIQLSPEDYLSHKIDQRIYAADDDEINVMAYLLNNYEFVDKLSEVPFTVHAAAVEKREVSEDALSGIIDLNTGEEIIPLIFKNKNQAEGVYERLDFPRTSAGWKMKPNEALESKYDKVIYSSVAIVSKNGKYGICDMHTGDVIIPCKHDLKSVSELWEELDNRETSLGNESPYGEIHNALLNEYCKVTRLGQVYFVTNDTRFIGGIEGKKIKGPYAVYSAISGNCIIPIDMGLTYYGCELLYKKLGCPTEPIEPSTLNDAKEGLDRSPIKK